jgi:hypothetical protein
MSTTTPAWLSVRIAELLRRAEEMVLAGLAVLGTELSAGIKPDADVVLSSGTVASLSRTVMEVAEVGERLRDLAERLPRDELRITYGAVRDGAARDLADGIMEARTALLAARVLDVPAGWSALAEALLSTDAPSFWGAMTPTELLSRFRGANAHEVRAVLADAGIESDASFAECGDDRIAQLASALLEHVRR